MVEPQPAPETLGLREFADLLGVSPSYVTQLKREGRLVLTEDGKRVRVAESQRLIADTRSPTKAGVAARHAAARGATVPDGGDEGDGGEGAAGAAPGARSAIEEVLSTRRARAQAEREEALARKALRDEQIELGQLVPADQVAEVVADATTALRTALENLPATIAPQLAAEPDEDRVRVMLSDALEHMLEDLARRFTSIGKPRA